MRALQSAQPADPNLAATRVRTAQKAQSADPTLSVAGVRALQSAQPADPTLSVAGVRALQNAQPADPTLTGPLLLDARPLAADSGTLKTYQILPHRPHLMWPPEGISTGLHLVL